MYCSPYSPCSLTSAQAQARTNSLLQLHARYSGDKEYSYDCHRAAQAWELAKLLRGAADRGHLALCLGDLNMLPLSLPYRILAAHAPVRDAWRVLHPSSSLGPASYAPEAARGVPIPSAEFNVRVNGTTSDSVYITWRWTPAQRRLAARSPGAAVVPPDAVDRPGQRLDYVFFGTSDVEEPAGAGWVVKDARVGMVEPHPTLGCSLSDHFSVEATLAYHAPPPPSPSPSHSRAVKAADSAALHNGAYLQTSPAPSPTPPDQLTAQLSSSPDDTPAPYDEILALTTAYTTRERRQRRLRAQHFLASLAVWIACLVGTWFTPPFASFILLLVGSLSLVAGVLDGLIALLFMGSELRALREFEWEVRNSRRRGEGDASASVKSL